MLICNLFMKIYILQDFFTPSKFELDFFLKCNKILLVDVTFPFLNKFQIWAI